MVVRYGLGQMESSQISERERERGVAHPSWFINYKDT